MYWLREAMGWVLVLLGLLFFFIAYVWLDERQWIFDAGLMTLAGIFVFRGGIHLLKVATAARICQQERGR